MLRSLAAADRIIVLQPRTADDLPSEFRAEVRVVLQSALPPIRRDSPRTGVFEVAVVGHLRPIKDPFRAAAAAALLDQSSTIRIVHLGEALTPDMAESARREQATNPRYQWLGDVPHDDAMAIMARCRLVAITSLSEGGPAVISEAIVADVPVIATRVSGCVGMLGDDYPGLFPAGDTKALATHVPAGRAGCRVLRIAAHRVRSPAAVVPARSGVDGLASTRERTCAVECRHSLGVMTSRSQPVIRRHLVLSVICAGICVCSSAADPIKYPESRREDRVDKLHGVEVPDPYRWLEDDVRKSAEVRDWVDAQRQGHSANTSTPFRNEKGSRDGSPSCGTSRSTRRLRKSAGATSSARTTDCRISRCSTSWISSTASRACCIDPNTWTKDGTIALGGTSVSPDARYLAYGALGSRLRLDDVEGARRRHRQAARRRVEMGQVLASIVDGRRQGLLLLPLSASRRKARRFSRSTSISSVMYHRVGTPQADDVLVYKRPDHPEWGFMATATDDGRYLIITTWQGTDDRYRITYRDLAEPLAMPIDLIDNFENDYTFIDNDGPVFYFRTDLQGAERPRHRHRHPQARARRLEGDHSAGKGNARRPRTSSAISSSRRT